MIVGARDVSAGREILLQLLESEQDWDRIITIGRRKPDGSFEDHESSGRLVHLVIDMDTLATNQRVESTLRDENVQAVFCALGTTRAVAGSAEGFKKVDLTYVASAAQVAKKSGAQQFSLVSAAGANAGLWASDWKPFHGLLYSKTKGLAEEAVKKQEFDFTTIVRPGFIDRKDKARSVEKLGMKVMPSISSDKIATVMIAEALANIRKAGGGPDSGKPHVSLWSMNDLKKWPNV